MKNFLLSGERSIARKVKEGLLALRIEETMSKGRILELYLNEIYLGRSYGVTAAASRYFGKTLDQLRPEEVAYLAALPKGPNNYHPIKNYDAAIARRNFVLKEMVENDHLSQEEGEAAKKRPLETMLSTPEKRNKHVAPRIDYFAEEVRRQMVEWMGEDRVYEGGLSVRTTYDPVIQGYAQTALRKGLERYDRDRGYKGPAANIDNINPDDDELWRRQLKAIKIPRDIDGWHVAVVLLVGQKSFQIGIEGVESVDPIYLPFSDVKGWAGKRKENGSVGRLPKKPADLFKVGDVIYVQPIYNKDRTLEKYSLRQIPDLNGAFMAMDPHTGRILAMQGGFSYQESVFNRATQATRQPGSSFKPFVYAAALENGYTPATIVMDAPVTVEMPDGTKWKPKNYSGKGRFYGPQPLRLGIEKSRNAMTVKIAQYIGMNKVAAYAEKFGVYDRMPEHLAYALGAGETTLYKMVSAYAMFVNGGRRVDPTLIDRIQNLRGETIYRHDQRICLECNSGEWDGATAPYVPDEREQVLDPVTAYQTVSMMEGVVLRGTASKLQKLGFPFAAKTGTTNEAKDAWLIGFSPDLVVGCFIGFDNPKPMGKGASGGGLCGPVVLDFMKQAGKHLRGTDFRKPSGIQMAKVSRRSGQRVPNETSGEEYIWEAFRVGTMPELYTGGVTSFTNTDGGLGTGTQTGVSDGTLSVNPIAPDDVPDIGIQAPQPGVIDLGSGGLY